MFCQQAAQAIDVVNDGQSVFEKRVWILSIVQGRKTCFQNLIQVVDMNKMHIYTKELNIRIFGTENNIVLLP